MVKMEILFAASLGHVMRCSSLDLFAIFVQSLLLSHGMLLLSADSGLTLSFFSKSYFAVIVPLFSVQFDRTSNQAVIVISSTAIFMCSVHVATYKQL